MTAALDRLPHDLIRLGAPAQLIGEGQPDWVTQAIRAAPWVVVRRAALNGDLIPVGVRGAERNARWAGWLSPDHMVERLSPEALPQRANALSIDRSALPALSALSPLAAILAGHGLSWGPTGSVGFELASGRPTVKATSDLDALVRCPRPLPRETAADLVRQIGELGVRCDLILETPAGGVALLEYARAEGPVAARGRDGPRLVDDPWAVEQTDGPRS